MLPGGDMKRYTWRCECGEFETDSNTQPVTCPVCDKPVKRVWKVNVAFHPTKGR